MLASTAGALSRVGPSGDNLFHYAMLSLLLPFGGYSFSALVNVGVQVPILPNLSAKVSHYKAFRC